MGATLEIKLMSICDLSVEDFCEAEQKDSEFTINRRDLERIISIYILNYFQDKNKYSPRMILPKYINLCIETDICNGVNKAYKAIEKSGRFETSDSEHSISEDIRYVIKTLGQIKKFVPQEFSAGVLLMHLEFIEGIELF